MIAVSKEELFSGPAYGCAGDPTQASGAGLVELGLMPQVTLTAEVFHQGTPNELGQELADGNWLAFRKVTAQLTMQRYSAQILAAIYGQLITSEADYIGHETALVHVTLPSFVIIPDYAKGAALANIGTTWLPAVRPDSINNLARQLQAGTDASTYTLALHGNRRAKDHADQVIKSHGQLVFQGNPAKALADGATVWSLPDGY